jgi:transposase-like protein
MPNRSRFTEDVRRTILQALAVGASRRTAAAVAGIDRHTLSRWISRGESAPAGSRFADFVAEVERAEATPRLRALATVNRDLADNAMLAWKFLERREDGFQPPAPGGPVMPILGPTTIELKFADGKPAVLPGSRGSSPRAVTTGMTMNPPKREVILVMPVPNSPAEDRAAASVHDALLGEAIELDVRDEAAWNLVVRIGEQVPGAQFAVIMPGGGTVWRASRRCASPTEEEP